MPQIGMDGLWEYSQVIFANLKSIFAYSCYEFLKRVAKRIDSSFQKEWRVDRADKNQLVGAIN